MKLGGCDRTQNFHKHSTITDKSNTRSSMFVVFTNKVLTRIIISLKPLKYVSELVN